MCSRLRKYWINPYRGSNTNWKATPIAAPAMTYGANTMERTAARPKSFWSSSTASASPITMDPATAKKVKIRVFHTIVFVSGAWNQSM